MGYIGPQTTQAVEKQGSQNRWVSFGALERNKTPSASLGSSIVIFVKTFEMQRFHQGFNFSSLFSDYNKKQLR
jgi:hypothetical protein